jgi:hypothetical protein
LESLKSASAYELGGAGSLYPVYMRGQAYLKVGDGQAAIEFQKMLEHRFVVTNSVLYWDRLLILNSVVLT